MVDLERTDINLPGGGTFTVKPVKGEVRRRMKVGGVSVSITEASEWDLGGTPPWQTPHFHKGKTETYTLVSGWMFIIWIDPNSIVHLTRFLSQGDTLTLPPGLMHNVLLGPSAVISTAVYGESVGNPERKNNDWWPVEGLALERILAAQKQVRPA